MSEYIPMFTSPAGEGKVLAAYGATLRKWSAPYDEINIPTSFGDTHVIVSGSADKPPLVLMHAMFATAAVWYPNAGTLSQYFRTYAVDVVGEANKSRPTRRITKLEDYGRWFSELLDGLGVHETALVGNSYGGFLSAYFAMSMPERISRLVLISPGATFHGMVPFYLHIFLPKALYLFFPWLPGQKRVMKRGIRWVHAGLRPDGPWARLFYMMMMYGTTATQVFPRIYSKEELARIKAPTLLLVGDREKIYQPQEVIEAARSLMPAIETAIIRDAHHIVALAQPAAVNSHIVRFCSPGTLNGVGTTTAQGQAAEKPLEITRVEEAAGIARLAQATPGLAR